MKIAFVGQEEYFWCHFETDLDDVYTVKPVHLRHNVDERYYDELLAFEPDITVVFRGEHLPTPIVSRLSGIKVAYSTEPLPKWVDGGLEFTADSILRFKNFLATFSRQYDYVFHYDELSRRFLERMGVKLSGFGALPIATRTWRPSRDLTRARDIFFLGRSTTHRERMMGAAKRDFDLLHLAHGWLGKSKRDIPAILELLGQFKIVLNLHAEPETSWEPRLQHMLACGCLVISEPISRNDLLKPGVHFVEVHDPHELYQTCARVLREPLAYKEIVEAGYRAVQAQLSASSWYPRFFHALTSGDFERATFDAALCNTTPLELAAEFHNLPHMQQYVMTYYA